MVVQTAEMAASELVTNGLKHHSCTIGEVLRLHLRAAPTPEGLWLSLSVIDAGRGRIKVPEFDGDCVDEHGRGLALLRAMGVTLTDTLLPRGYQVTASMWADAEGESAVQPSAFAEAEPPRSTLATALAHSARHGGLQRLSPEC